MLASLPRGYPLHSNFACPSIPPNMHFIIHRHLLSLCIESSQFIHVHHQQFISFVFSSTQYIFHVHILFLLFSSCLDFYLPFIVLEHSYHHQQTPHVHIDIDISSPLSPLPRCTSLPLPKRPRDTSYLMPRIPLFDPLAIPRPYHRSTLSSHCMTQ